MAGFFHWYESKLSVGQPENKTLKKTKSVLYKLEAKKSTALQALDLFCFSMAGRACGKGYLYTFSLVSKGKIG